MTLLTCIQDAARELGLVAPSSVVTATTDLVAQQLLAAANRGGRELRTEYDWPQLTKEYTFTLTSGTASYAMPADFDRFAFSTHWDRSNSWEMAGPISEMDWQAIKSGVVTAPLRKRWRFKGYTTNQFFLADTPGADDDGNTMVFEYYTKNWLRPRLWAASTAYTSGEYAFYNGNYYTAGSSATSGSTPPTHTTGSASDGTITWTYVSTPYERATADTDVSHIDENLITLEIKWRYRAAKMLDGWEVMKMEADAAAHRLSGANRGATNINLNTGRFARCAYDEPETPETFG